MWSWLTLMLSRLTTKHQVTIKWTASTDSVSGYNVYRGTSAGSETNKLNSQPIQVTTFTDSKAVVGTRFYAVRSVFGNLLSVLSNSVKVTIK
jgi:hypothetical protein